MSSSRLVMAAAGGWIGPARLIRADSGGYSWGGREARTPFGVLFLTGVRDGMDRCAIFVDAGYLVAEGAKEYLGPSARP
jgi:hypothetical protein